MTPGDTARVLTKAAAFDQRTIGEADVLAWHEALSDLNAADALAAVTDHYATSDQRLMPVHIRRIATARAKDRARDERERQERRALAADFERAVPHPDRSAEFHALVRKLADKLGPSDPDVLRRAEWVREERQRQRAIAGPNPHYVGPPPPGGWPMPSENIA